ncbi:Uncharacterized protein family UPF0016 [Musa troglodytarum]|uniref:GDT1 family protein n=1 Tax=Musa troglodytarum TaxID=320322 RepID=A0A9E7FTQ5_9LILI|nr:Uncharacterized protein family UPF0016 [Musa troglodytarum]
MGLSLIEGFTKSLAMTVLSEIGDKTFFAAAVNPASFLSFSTFYFSLFLLYAVTEFLPSANDDEQLQSNYTMRASGYYYSTAARNRFLVNGHTTSQLCCSLDLGCGHYGKDLKKKGMNADWKAETGSNKGNTKGSDDLKKRQRPFLTHFFSPIFLKAFSITFFGEWGDKSQIATIGLASDENPVGVVLGGIVGQALCTTAAVIGGKSLASQISEKMVALSSGILFLVFGLQSFLAAAGES